LRRLPFRVVVPLEVRAEASTGLFCNPLGPVSASRGLFLVAPVVQFLQPYALVIRTE
jgi:hypothetical protein